MLRLESPSTSTAEPPSALPGRVSAREPKSRAAESTEDLLHRYAQTGTSECFEEIVRRYGAMVLAVCQAVTHDRHDAEDATQVTFFVLSERVRAGETIRSLGSWLQQVARRAAVDIRRSHSRRQRRERNRATPEVTPDSVAQECEGDQIAALVREELDRIPAKYRIPLVLHYFGGLEFNEAAAQLGLKPATLGVRLFRGRKLLGERLARRGIALSVPALTACLARVIRTSLSHSLRQSAAKAACSSVPHALAATPGIGGGVLSVFASSKVKLLAAAALLVAASAGARAAVHHLPDLPSLLDLGRFRIKPPSIRSSLPALAPDVGDDAPQVAQKPVPTKEADPAGNPIKIDLSPAIANAPQRVSNTPQAGRGGSAGGGVLTYASAANSRTNIAGAPAGAVPTARPGAKQPWASSPTPGASTTVSHMPNSPLAMNASKGSTVDYGPNHAPGAPGPAGGPLAMFAGPNNAAGLSPSGPGASITATSTGGTPPSGATFLASADGGSPLAGGSSTPGAASTIIGQISPPSTTVAPVGGAASIGTPAFAGAAPVAPNASPYAGLLQITSSGQSPQLSFLAPGDASVPQLPAGHQFLGIWKVTGRMPDVPLTLSCDRQLLSGLGNNPSQVSVWSYDGKWTALTTPDPSGDLTIQNPGTTQFYAIGTPEPAGAAVGAVVGLLLLMRRRRTSGA